MTGDTITQLAVTLGVPGFLCFLLIVGVISRLIDKLDGIAETLTELASVVWVLVDRGGLSREEVLKAITERKNKVAEQRRQNTVKRGSRRIEPGTGERAGL